MKKLIAITLCLLTFLTITAAVAEEAETEVVMTVAVGIVPEATFVEAVAGDLVEIVTLIPPGYSPANYQPTTTEMQQLSDATVYFTLQMPTERTNILPVVEDFNADLEIVDLREAVLNANGLLNTDGEKIDTTEDQSVDPHVWLSPKNAIVMVETIANTLSELDPDNEATYQANAASYIAELEALDAEIEEALASLSNKSFLIYHAAYNYFANDYGLEQIAIEIEGKQATAEELQNVIDTALASGITTVFYEEEFDDSQAQTVAEEIDGTVQVASPLSSDYMQGLRDFVSALVEAGE